MDTLIVQVQPERLFSFADNQIEQLQVVPVDAGTVQGVEVQEGNESGRYINVSFTTTNLKVLWPAIRKNLVRLGLQKASIVTCTGSQGWDNYLLLHHFDREVPTDASRAL